MLHLNGRMMDLQLAEELYCCNNILEKNSVMRERNGEAEEEIPKTIELKLKTKKKKKSAGKTECTYAEN